MIEVTHQKLTGDMSTVKDHALFIDFNGLFQNAINRWNLTLCSQIKRWSVNIRQIIFLWFIQLLHFLTDKFKDNWGHQRGFEVQEGYVVMPYVIPIQR